MSAWTPQTIITVTISLVMLLITLFGVAYGMGRLLAQFALKTDMEQLRQKIDSDALAQYTKSQEAHRELASKSAVTKLEGNLLELEKELRLDVKELRESMDLKFEKTHAAHAVIVDLLTKISHQTKRGTNG